MIQASQPPKELRAMSVPACLPIAGLLVHRLPAFADNYLWLLQSGARAMAVDPGDAEIVARALAMHDLALAAILVTHHHPDHVGGVAALAADQGCPVYGARDPRLPMVTEIVGDGDRIQVADFPEIVVWHVPGHTRTHLAFLLPGAIFVGDTLFGAGCGRVFEGDPTALHGSLERIAALPDTTQVFCAHEYTRANLAFAAAVEPDNPAIAARHATLAIDPASVPFALGTERQSNVFLRCALDSVRAAASRHAQQALVQPSDVFVALRQWKNTHA